MNSAVSHIDGSTNQLLISHGHIQSRLALCVAAGFKFFGRKVRRVGVVYIAAEAGTALYNRVAVAKEQAEFPSMMPLAAITSQIDLCNSMADLERLVEAIRSVDLGFPVGLIIIDTLSRVMGAANENAPDDMGALVRNIDRLRSELNVAVLLVHHSGKDANRGARGTQLIARRD